ncbi:methionine ABC transporter permease [Ferrimonas lipolytica]|uniref:ABC transporter permease n=1 Tax=Ferrimonas lipolytica TaxID=2724191 RepID=A0A6H1UE32_9GAMM|nr:methionine ABC transporter permease [Ferrimonas lipolytica]QIZ76850.1 ABC transporter permease [Ferrimonas lipolytica]
MSTDLIPLLWDATLQTLQMVLVAGAMATLFGVPLGVVLHLSKKGQLLENRLLHRSLGLVVNIGRSVPFIILLVAIIPFTRMIVGTSIGTIAAIVPLTIGAIPFIARLIEAALIEVPVGLIEAAQAMGADKKQTIIKILLPEALPGIVNSITITLVTLVSYSAMAGAVGGGGLGDVGIRYGYYRFEPDVMIATIVVLLILVQLFQSLGDAVVRRIDHR